MPCTSETDLESMVVETNQGPDIFIPIDKEHCSCRKCKNSTAPICSALNRKVWICHSFIKEECRIRGHYIYQTQPPHCQITQFFSGACDLEEKSKIQLMKN